MRNRKAFLTVIANQNSEPVGITLPYTFDPSALSDGNLPVPWNGSTFQISGGVVVNNPTLGAELLTDPGLEGTYTDGLCDGLTKVGSPTVAQSADVHGGSKAQGITTVANSNAVSVAGIAATDKTWYLLSAWVKRASGANNSTGMNLSQGSGKPFATAYGNAHTSGSYVQRFSARRTNSTNPMGALFVEETSSPGDALIVDDVSLKTMVESSLMAIVDSHITDQTVKGKFNWSRDGFCGVVARCNADKTSYIIAFYAAQSISWSYCCMYKCINGTWTELVADWSNSPGAGGGETPTNSQWLEIRCSGNTIKLYHNNLQVGTDQTVSDAEITGNTYAGHFNTGGGSSLASFFLAAS